MIEAETILKLIETVSPDDTAKLDEIDCHIHKFIYRWSKSINWMLEHLKYFPQVKYTRSRDVLKAIRPKGWDIRVTTHPNSNSWMVYLDGSRSDLRHTSPWLPNEELAELHAIIQAMKFERI